MKELSQLKEKFTCFYQKETTQDFLSVTPYLKDAVEWVNDVSKYSNDIKLFEAWRCISQDNDVEKSINQLYNYVSNEERAFFVSDSFKKIILCNSRVASAIIAYIMGEIITEKRNFEHTDAVLYNTLLQMTDYDIKNFKYLMENAIGRFSEDDNIVNDSKLPENKESFEITIQICVSTGVFRTESGVIDGNSFYSDNFCKVTNLANVLLDYINNVNRLLSYEH